MKQNLNKPAPQARTGKAGRIVPQQADRTHDSWKRFPLKQPLILGWLPPFR